jgi:hypothetical protein
LTAHKGRAQAMASEGFVSLARAICMAIHFPQDTLFQKLSREEHIFS